MKKSTTSGLGYWHLLNALTEDEVRYERTKRGVIVLLMLTFAAFVAWGIYVIHLIQYYRLIPTTLR